MILWLILAAVVAGIMFRVVQLGIRRGGHSFYASLYLALGMLMFLSLTLEQSEVFGASARLPGTFGGVPFMGMTLAAALRNAAGPWSVAEQVWFIKFNRLVLLTAAPLFSVTIVVAQQNWTDAVMLFIGAMVALWPLYKWRKGLEPLIHNH